MPPWNPHFGYSKVLSQQVFTFFSLLYDAHISYYTSAMFS